ncbi:hypothetical protein LCGC14_1287040 [marine sediment metagenome]|uniref:Uncharacterized protein n=1 Tax=marine sediment metagenome TaxID=412755 RepID=A0A0F9NWH9_9ZZZZ
MTAPTAEELKAKEEEETSSQVKEKVTSQILKSTQKDQSTEVKSGELSDAQKLKIYEIQSKTVREQGARLSATEKELAELRAAKEEAAKPTVEESAKSFYADPTKAIKDALALAIAPLNEFKDRIESETSYDRIKKNLMANPVYAQHLGNAQFSAVVDALVAEGQKTTGQVTEAMVEATIKHTIGSVVTGDIVLTPVKGSETNETLTTDRAKEEETKLIPPYLHPSSPPFRKADDKKQYRDLTENEARLAKERGMTKEQYLDWLVVDPSDVIDSKIGVPEKGGDK